MTDSTKELAEELEKVNEECLGGEDEDCQQCPVLLNVRDCFSK